MRAIVKKAGAAAFTLALIASNAAYAQLSNTGDAESVAEELERAAQAPTTDVADPWEGFNRKMFATHMFLDEAFLVPSAKAYRAVTPAKGRKGIRKFLHNARTPVILINDVLQGEWKRAGNTSSRFVINSTIGFLGFADPAAHMGIKSHDEDFGQTLAAWGVSPGPYLFLPLLGPSSIRDGFGAGVDLALDPLIWVRTDPAKYARYSRAGVTGLAVREPLIEPLEDIQEKSLDYYASLRSFYLQARRREINNGRTSYEDLPDIGEFEEFDELE